MSDNHYLLIGPVSTVTSIHSHLGIESRTTKFYKYSFPDFKGIGSIFNAVIVHMTDNDYSERISQIYHLKELHSNLPIVAVLSSKNINLALECGKAGVERVFDMYNTRNFEKEIKDIIEKINVKVRLNEFNILSGNFPNLIQRALRCIEQNYVRFMSVADVANILGVSECTISREFKKNGLLGPKKILLYFKIRHALKLLGATNHSIRVIANSSGFSNEKRLIECFHRVFLSSPNECRKKNTIEDSMLQVCNAVL